MKYRVWIKEDGLWVENGDGPITLKQAERISTEIRRGCKVATKIAEENIEPWPTCEEERGATF